MMELPKPDLKDVPFSTCTHPKIIYDGKYKRCGNCNRIQGKRSWCLRCDKMIDSTGWLVERCRCSQPVRND